MTVANIADILIAVAVLAWIIYRQFTWRLVDPNRMWRMPVVLIVVGIFMLAQTKSVEAVRAVDVGILACELLLALAVGAAMGALARFRSRPQRAGDVASRRGDPIAFDPAVTVVDSRTGGVGAALWLILIAVRVGIEIGVTQFFPSALLASTGTILIVIAANRAARAFVIASRVERMHLAAA